VPAADTAKCKSILQVEMAKWLSLSESVSTMRCCGSDTRHKDSGCKHIPGPGQPLAHHSPPHANTKTPAQCGGARAHRPLPAHKLLLQQQGPTQPRPGELRPQPPLQGSRISVCAAAERPVKTGQVPRVLTGQVSRPCLGERVHIATRGNIEQRWTKVWRWGRRRGTKPGRSGSRA
jgi:hypothetical protein